MKLQTLHSKCLEKTPEGYALSIYQGVLDERGIAQASKKIEGAFPNLESGFYQVFFDRIKMHGFTNERLLDAIDHVIDTCEYPNPTIAKFISYDQKIQLFTYDQMIKKSHEMQGIFKLYSSVQIADLKSPLWASNQDIEKYKLKRFRK